MKKRVYIPQEIIRLIMTCSGLDLKTMIKCMVVNKQWNNVISDLISNGDLQFLVYNFGTLHNDFSPCRFGALHDDTHRIASMATLNLPPAGWLTGSPRVTSSCNGLVCLLGPRDEDIYICNPIIGGYVFFPNIPKSKLPYDLGFCPSSNEYKLTTFTRHTLEICTLRSPIRWRSVPFDHRWLRGPVRAAICVSRVFHWLLETQSVLTFDLTKEVFGLIPPPRLEDGKEIYQLGCLDHFLVVTAGYNFPSGLDIWMRKVDKSLGEPVWTKNWVIGAAQSLDQEKIYSRFDFRQLTPQKLSSDGRIFMQTYGPISEVVSYRSLCCYDPRNKLVTPRYIVREVVAYYTPTLVSPEKLMPKTDIVED